MNDPIKRFHTADICDRLGDACSSCEMQLRQFGRRHYFAGPIRTVRCHEDNSLVRAALEGGSSGQVLVVDGGGSLRCALLGDRLAAAALHHGWSGIVIHGAIRDSGALAGMEIGIKALGCNPRKSKKHGAGVRDVPVAFGGVSFVPGFWLWSDEDGIVVAPQPVSAGQA